MTRYAYSLVPYHEILSLAPEEVNKIGDSVKIPLFSQEHLLDIIKTAKRTISMNPPLRYLNGPIVVVGDLHGNFHDLIRILLMNGLPPKTHYLFLGDYVDRGDFSIEVITLLLLLKINFPEEITLLRGNHEFRKINETYGFLKSVKKVYGNVQLWEEFNICFDYLPFAAVIDNYYFCVHGGISSDLNSLSQINNIQLPFRDDATDKLVEDLVWSDPNQGVPMFESNPRGPGQYFGIIAVSEFFKNTGLKMIIRAHECVNGMRMTLQNQVCTVFSSSNYNRSNNDGGFLYIDSTHKYVKKYKAISVKRWGDSFFVDIFKNDDPKPSEKADLILSLLKVNSKRTHLPSRTFIPKLGVQTYKRQKHISLSTVFK